MLKTNLVGDEKELFYLLEFLQVKVDLSQSFDAWFDDRWLADTSTACSDWKKLIKAKDASKKIRKLKSHEDLTLGGEMNENKEKMELHEAMGIIEEKVSPKAKKITIDKPRPPITTSLSRILDMHQKDLDFSLVSLPENFYDSYHGFIYKSCDLCHCGHSKSDLILCLLCGELMCGHSCKEGKPTLGSLR